MIGATPSTSELLINEVQVREIRRRYTKVFKALVSNNKRAAFTDLFLHKATRQQYIILDTLTAQGKNNMVQIYSTDNYGNFLFLTDFYLYPDKKTNQQIYDEVVTYLDNISK